jgi:hypothetical protein
MTKKNKLSMTISRAFKSTLYILQPSAYYSQVLIIYYIEHAKKPMEFRVAYNIDDDVNTFPYVGEVVLKGGDS